MIFILRWVVNIEGWNPLQICPTCSHKFPFSDISYRRVVLQHMQLINLTFGTQIFCVGKFSGITPVMHACMKCTSFNYLFIKIGEIKFSFQVWIITREVDKWILQVNVQVKTTGEWDKWIIQVSGQVNPTGEWTSEPYRWVDKWILQVSGQVNPTAECTSESYRWVDKWILQVSGQVNPTGEWTNVS